MKEFPRREKDMMKTEQFASIFIVYETHFHLNKHWHIFPVNNRNYFIFFHGEILKLSVLKMIEMDGNQSRIALYFALGNCSQRLRIPARSVRCNHSNCFDLEAFLIANQDNSYFECPFTPCK